MRSESLAPAVGLPPNPADAPAPRRIHGYLTALPGLLAEAALAEVHVEGRDRRTGALVAYSFVTIHRALALHVAEAVRAGLARLELEGGRAGSGRDPRVGSDGTSRQGEAAASPVAPEGRDGLPGQYL